MENYIIFRMTYNGGEKPEKLVECVIKLRKEKNIVSSKISQGKYKICAGENRGNYNKKKTSYS